MGKISHAPTVWALSVTLLTAMVARAAPDAARANRLRVMIETDAGGDPDDEQSLVRFLLYCNEWDVEGILATRPKARDGENLNPRRTGLGIVRSMIDAYGQCHANLIRHDPHYATPDHLRRVTVAGYGDVRDGVDLVLAAVDRNDPRPLWFCNWGTDDGSDPSSLRRALDEVLRDRGREGYARFKSRLRLSSDDKFGDHTAKIDPPFPLWVDTFRPEVDRRRWYHRFSALTATAGGFDVRRDMLTGHGPLGAMYPLNTTHPQKEGDTMTFLYLVPTGMNDVDQPTWGSWAGRYGPNEKFPGRPYHWANQQDEWNGTRSRDNIVARWAEHLQNDFRARLDWCVKGYADANHPPTVELKPTGATKAKAAQRVTLDASASRDPDGNAVRFHWGWYPEAGTFRGPPIAIDAAPDGRTAAFTAPRVEAPCAAHLLLAVTDAGDPPLTRYHRLVVNLEP